MLTGCAFAFRLSCPSSLHPPSDCPVWICRGTDIPFYKLCHWMDAIIDPTSTNGTISVSLWVIVSCEASPWNSRTTGATRSAFFAEQKAQFQLISIIRGNNPMWICFREKFPSYHTGVSQQPSSWRINNGGFRAVPATAGRGQGRAHRWCWDGPARHQHAPQQWIQRERRAVQEIQVWEQWRKISMLHDHLIEITFLVYSTS